MTDASPGRLAGRRAVVTGGGSGIGRASALRPAHEGARVAVFDIREALAEETAAEIRAAGGDAFARRCDVGSEPEVEAATGDAVARFGGLEILAACAGSGDAGAGHELTLHDWEMVLRVNLTGMFLAAKHALRPMLAGGGGSIVTIGSISSVVIGPGGSAASYKAAKGGVLQLTRAIAVEYAQEGIRANCVCPGAVSTNLGLHNRELPRTTQPTFAPFRAQNQTPLARRADPAEIAATVAFLASDDASFITGAAIMVDGGLTAI